MAFVLLGCHQPRHDDAMPAATAAGQTATAPAAVPSAIVADAGSSGGATVRPDVYPGARSPDWEAAMPHCIGHGHLAYCFYRIAVSPLRFTAATPPPYATWPSTGGARPLCGGHDPPCEPGFGQTGPWLTVPAARVELRPFSECRPATDRNPSVCTLHLQARAAGTTVRSDRDVMAGDGSSIWARSDEQGILVERLFFVGE